MAYTALYRKFRPDTYEDVKGQEHITTTLSNQIVSDRVGHAYLFCGTRGTGKTTIAKIFAKAVNCERSTNGNPCNECDSCRRIKSGNSLNVIEMDAATNNSVDDVRQIVEEVQYRPTQGRYKVYIIDEVHMLSPGAFNALLKTLEEPPEYVIFVLATTEAHKIPITILSRCQRYDFKHIMVDTIQARLQELAEIEGLKAEEKALRFIARSADGSMRDALSLLDRCQAFCMNQELTYERALNILGAVDTEVFSEMLRAIINKDTVSCIRQVEEIVNFGRDLSQFIVDFTWYLRNLLLVKTSDGAEEIIDMSAEKMNRLKEEAQMVESGIIVRFIRILSELTNQLRRASQQRVLVEIALIKLTQPSMGTQYEDLVQRIRDLEDKLENGMVVQQISGAIPVEQNTKRQVDPARPKLQKAVLEEVQEIAKQWTGIVVEVGGRLGSSLKKQRLSADGHGKLCVVYYSELDFQMDNKPENIEVLKELIAKRTNREVDIEFRLVKQTEEYESNYISLMEEKIMFEIEESDDEEIM